MNTAVQQTRTEPLVRSIVMGYTNERLVSDFEFLCQAIHEQGLGTIEREVRTKNLAALRAEILSRLGVVTS